MMMKIKKGLKSKWLVLDKIKAIEYEYTHRTNAQKVFEDLKGSSNKHNKNEMWIENYSIIDEKPKHLALIKVTYENDETGWIITDDAVYVLNNEGKTCDSVGVYNK